MTHEHLDQLALDLLGRSYDELNDVQKRVVDLIVAEQPSGPGGADDEEGTFWTRLADKVAAVGGSWAFIGGFSLALLLWIGWNVLAKPLGLVFDPYPFIFLNLMLSTVAAIQAPVIMMSQNRQAAKDRLTAEHDYAVNLRAELEIMRVIDKLDALRSDELMLLCREHAERLALLQDEVTRLRGERG